MAVPWATSFVVFRRVFDGLPMWLTVDVGALDGAPWPSHPMRSTISLQIEAPDVNGLPGPPELRRLSEVEDRIGAVLELGLDAWFVGRFSWKGARTAVYYLPDAPPRRPLDLAELGAPYVPRGSLIEDAQWSYVIETLAPSERERWMTRNAVQLQAREDRGDHLDQVRLVDHVGRFDSQQAALSAAASLRAKGFEVEVEVEASAAGDGDVVLKFGRADVLSGVRPDEFVFEVLDALAPHHGRYDGWGAPIVR